MSENNGSTNDNGSNNNNGSDTSSSGSGYNYHYDGYSSDMRTHYPVVTNSDYSSEGASSYGSYGNEQYNYGASTDSGRTESTASSMSSASTGTSDSWGSGTSWGSASTWGWSSANQSDYDADCESNA